jgi:hypothetical protein
LTKGKITLLNNSYKRNENGKPNKENINKNNAIIEKNRSYITTEACVE